jgi:hypothetical protein
MKAASTAEISSHQCMILVHVWIEGFHRYVERTVSRDDFSRASAGLATSGRRFQDTPRHMAEEVCNGGGRRGGAVPAQVAGKTTSLTSVGDASNCAGDDTGSP